MELFVLAVVAIGALIFFAARSYKAPLSAQAVAGPARAVHLDEDGDYETDVVGESHYQDALAEICGGKTRDGHERDCTATLRLEPENPHDGNAVAVWIEGRKVGYLARQLAATFTAAAHRNGVNQVTCGAMIVGGWDRGSRGAGHFGVKLDLFNDEDELDDED